MVKVVLVFALAAALNGSASAATPTATMLRVVSWAAGHPTSIACDADVNPSPFPAPPGQAATAWTYTGGSVIHAYPQFCVASGAPVGSDSFARAIDVFLHEAARARGFSDDSCVELFADLAVYQALRDFYGAPFFSSTSVLVGGEVLALTRTLPAAYQPESCWRSGSMR